MATADQIASVIIARSGSYLDPMKLQKLLYYTQAWHLAITGQPLFSDRIKAWKAGPVVPEVRARRTAPETRRAAAQDLSGISLDDIASDLIDLVLASYGSMSAEELSALTHTEQPWQTARGDLPPDAHCSTEISQAEMAEFFRAERRLGNRTAADLAAGGIESPHAGLERVGIDEFLAGLGDEWSDPGRDALAGGNLVPTPTSLDDGIKARPQRLYAER